MASQVQYGSKGSDVKKLQQTLNRSGYKLAEDGIFGAKTQAAVKDYQKKNKLAVDGIVGTNTWGALLKANTANTTASNAKNTTATKAANTTATNTSGTVGTGFEYKDFSYDDFQHDAYQESETVAAAKAALESQLANKPGGYQSQWQSQLDEAINKILNREKFSYDLNGDALYQQYKDKYIQQGKMAMADTMGQAAAMTGGYGNSYAASVGNQAYQASLQQLNDIVPELYQMAYDRYNQEGQDLYNQYAMLGERENADYGRYRDSVSDWQAERDYLTGRYDTERNLDYSKYTDERNFQYGKYADDRNFAYGQYADDKSYAYNDYRNKIEDAQWQATFDESLRQYNEQFAYQQDRDAVADSQWDQSFQYQKDRDAVADSQWDKTFQYQQDRDAVSDSQWREELDRLLANDKISQTQWQAEMDRLLDNDKISQEQWQAEMDRLLANDKTANDQWNKEFEEKYGSPVLAEGSQEYWDNYNSKYESGSFNNGTLSQDKIKQLQKVLGVTADGLYGEKSKKAAGGLSAEEAYKKFVGGGGDEQPKTETADDYADWDAGDWEGYFATIRNTKSKAAAEEELNRMTKAGLIPTKMVTYAAIGARGSLGH